MALLFLGNNFYPHGGFEDFIGEFDSIEDAMFHAENNEFDNLWFEGWGHIVIENKIVLKGYFDEDRQEKWFWELPE